MRFLLLITIFSFFHILEAKQTLSEHAEEVLNSVKYDSLAPSIIGEREWKELQLDRLVTILDRTQTSFGRWGLVQLLHPIADEKELSNRKEIITYLIEHEDEMRDFQEQLKRVKDVEKSLLAYWDKRDELNASAKQFYYTVLGLKELNKSSAALNASTVMEFFNSFKYLVAALACEGLSTEFKMWLFGGKEKLDILGGLLAGLESPIKQHSFSSTGAIDPAKKKYNYKDHMRAFTYGSLGDRYTVLNKGYATPAIPLWFFRWQLLTIPAKEASSFGVIPSFVSAVIPTIFFDYQWGNAVISTGKRIMSMHRTLHELQQRVSDVAQCIDAIKKLNEIVSNKTPILRSYLNDNDECDHEKQEELVKKLLAPRFLKKSDYLYSRGHVLTMHLDLTHQKKTLIPLLHSIALLDAYCSIAQLYKESQNKAVKFSFAQFIDSEKPLLSYRDAWLPLLPLEQAIANDLVIGDGSSAKMIITGPNGGGKSTILKTFGVVSVLAQSWGIVPAKEGWQVLFSAIRTALAPHEDLSQGLSTFMAEKKAMAELLEEICRADQEHYMLALIDEPYKGTVDAESAKRIYQFGKDIAQYPDALVTIATHVRKPIMLAQEMPSIFGNYQVKINEIGAGVFERIFKLESGPAMWWFEDDEKRSRFVDWISISGNGN
jgi:hypothetical protein